MQPQDYPPQEPFSAPALAYHEEVMRRGQGLPAEEASYGADPYQSVAIFRTTKPKAPVLAFLHGGGWTNGYKEWMNFMAPPLVAAGVTFVSVGYRLAPANVFPTGFDDACAGVAWMAAHAAEWGADPARLFVGGHSAGGHYAALMALTRPALGLRGCLPISGVYDFGPESGMSMRPRFLGPVGSGTQRAASPIAQIAGTPIPFFIAHGSEDFPHLSVQAATMEAALRAAGGDVERLVMPGRNHFTASYAGGEPDGPWLAPALDWIERH